MKKEVKPGPGATIGHSLKMMFLIALRNPKFNLLLNVGMLFLNGVASVEQFLEGNFVLGNILLVSTLSCLSAVAYWSFFVWDRRNESKNK